MEIPSLIATLSLFGLIRCLTIYWVFYAVKYFFDEKQETYKYEISNLRQRLDEIDNDMDECLKHLISVQDRRGKKVFIFSVTTEKTKDSVDCHYGRVGNTGMGNMWTRMRDACKKIFHDELEKVKRMLG